MLSLPATSAANGPLLYDDGPLSAEHGLIAPFQLPSTWPTNEISYGFVNSTSGLSELGRHETFRQAFKLWSDVTPLTFYEVDPADAQIRISWVTGDHGDGHPFDGAGGVLAHAFVPGLLPLSGDIHFDDAEAWASTPAPSVDLFTVAAHQIGHALGLGHSTDPSALMYPHYTGSRLALAADDITAIQSLYGVAPSGPRFFARNGNSTGVPSAVAGYGDPGDYPLVGDWDGDGIDTIGVYRPSTRQFFLNDQFDGSPPEHATAYGDPNDIPLVGDWDGDGRDTIGLYRPSTRQFLLNDQNDASPPEHAAAYGDPGDIPLVGDWNGDGRDTIGVYRPSIGAFFLNDQNDGSPPEHAYLFTSGAPVVGDWNGDGTDEVGTVSAPNRSEPAVHEWRLRNGHGCCSTVTSFPFGHFPSHPIPGDWDGDGVTTVGFFIYE